MFTPWKRLMCHNLVSISSTFYIQIFRTNVVLAAFFYVHVTREKLQKQCSYDKFVRKMLMTLTTDIRIRNFDYSKTQKSQAKVKVIFLD